jgi:hypothetical protein
MKDFGQSVLLLTFGCPYNFRRDIYRPIVYGDLDRSHGCPEYSSSESADASDEDGSSTDPTNTIAES